MTLSALLALLPGWIVGWGVVLWLLFPAGTSRCRVPGSSLVLGAALGPALLGVLAYVSLQLFGDLRLGYRGVEWFGTLLAGFAVLVWGWRMVRSRARGAELSLSTRRGWPPMLLSLLGWVPVVAGTVIFLQTLGRYWQVNPMGQQDAFAFWMPKAQFLLMGGEYWAHIFSGDIPHRDYPLGFPLQVARAWLHLGTSGFFGQHLVAASQVVLLPLLMYAWGAQLRGPLLGAVAALILLMTPGVLYWSWAQYADVPLALLLLAAWAVAVWSLNESRRLGSAAVVGLLAGAAAWTKNEGLVAGAALLLMYGAGLIIREGLARGGRRMIGCLLGTLPFLLVLILHKGGYAADTDLLTRPREASLSDMLLDWERHRTILEHFFGYVFQVIPVGALMLLLLMIFLSGPLRSWQAALPALLVLGGCGLTGLVYYGVYLTTPHDLAWHLGTSQDRLILQLWPATVLGCVLLARERRREVCDASRVCEDRPPAASCAAEATA